MKKCLQYICVYQLYQVSTALPKGFDYIYIIQYEVATAIPSGYGYTKWLQQYQMAMLWLWLHVSSRRNTKVSNLGPFLVWRVMLFSRLQQILFIVHTTNKSQDHGHGSANKLIPPGEKELKYLQIGRSKNIWRQKRARIFAGRKELEYLKAGKS